MRLLFLLIPIFYLHALEIQVNFGKEQNQDFSILNLKHKTAFECLENKDVYGKITSITCTIPKTPINNFVPTNTALFNLSNAIINGNLVLTITPKYQLRLFATFLDLKAQNRIPKERPKKSKQWQIVGFKDKIPFLSDHSSTGLNFPIQIPSNNDLYITQLDINLNPLHYEEGLDFKQLQGIKNLYEQKNYKQAIKQASIALKTYPGSIFEKDFLLYKIKATSHLLSKENLDDFISSSIEWIKQSPSDKNMPEILYHLANAYILNTSDKEAYYNYRRIIDEYPQTEWNALAKMQLAKHFSDQSTLKVAPNLFAEAYAQAHSKQIKNEILLEWGLALISRDKKEANNLIQTIIKDDPQFFLTDPNQTSLTLKKLVAHDMYHLASQIGSLLFPQISKEDSYQEQLLFDLGDWYEQADDTKEAHHYNQLYLKSFPNSKRIKTVAARDDRLLFKMGKNLSNDEKIALYDQIIQKYPNTDAAHEAYLKKAQLLFDLKQYPEVLKLQEFIPQSPLIAQSKTQIILDLLKNKQCKQIPHFFKGSNTQDLSHESRIELFDCLYSIAYYSDAKSLIPNLDQQEAQSNLPWIYRTSKVLNKLGDFIQSRKAGEDALSLAQALNDKQYLDIGFTLFDDLTKLNLISQAQKLLPFLEKNFNQDSRMLEVWYALLKNAQTLGDQNAVQIYAKEILSLQQKIKFFDYTPNVDFILIYSLMQSKQYDQANTYLESLLKQKIQSKDLQKAFYMQGALLKAMGKDYKASFEKCLQIQEQTNWQNLCKKSLQD
ncbi:tetratricopeptide repeat protein [Helicobacter pametensis]|uniref:tetratricopeptide repeat protein n=1 Tax=Helicobacter pametensis TaxID=95149 RepID=UPI0004841475|nr:tetratricopeptide repeat protein [Helicobacter pametensis]